MYSRFFRVLNREKQFDIRFYNMQTHRVLLHPML